MMRCYEDDRPIRIPLYIRLMPLSVLTRYCDFGWKVQKFMWKFQKKREPYTGDIKFYFDLYDDNGNPKQQ